MQRSEAGIEAQKALQTARQRAYRRLAQSHAEEYKKLVAEESRAIGLTPLPMGRPKVNA